MSGAAIVLCDMATAPINDPIVKFVIRDPKTGNWKFDTGFWDGREWWWEGREDCWHDADLVAWVSLADTLNAAQLGEHPA